MSPRRYPPAYLRYLKARLWNLARPGFWGTAIFLSVVGLIIKEYWTRPDFFTSFSGQKKQVASQKPTNSTLSAEDKAIAADIDNLPVLFYDIDSAASLAATTTTPKQNTQPNNNNSLLNDISKQQAAATNAKSNSGLKLANPTPTAKVENPFVVQAENLLRLQNFQNRSNFLGVNSFTALPPQQGAGETSFAGGTGLTNRNNSTQNIAPVDALQTALNQSSTNRQDLPNLNNNGTSSIQANPFERSQPTNSLPNQTFSPSTGLIQEAIAPVTYGTDYTQIRNTNPSQNPISIPNNPNNPNNNIDSRSTYTQNQYPNRSVNNLSTYIQNQFPDIYNRFNSNQPFSNVPSPAPTVTPIAPIAPNITPNYTQTPNQGVVTPSNSPSNPAVTNYNENFRWQQPTQAPQYNSSSPAQIPGQSTGNGQVNANPYQLR